MPIRVKKYGKVVSTVSWRTRRGDHMGFTDDRLLWAAAWMTADLCVQVGPDPSKPKL